MITLGGVEHCFAYVVEDDVVDTVIGPPDYIEQVLNERRQNPEKRGRRCRARTTTSRIGLVAWSNLFAIASRSTASS